MLSSCRVVRLCALLRVCSVFGCQEELVEESDVIDVLVRNAVGGGLTGPPLAVKRLTASKWPMEFPRDSRDAMMAARSSPKKLSSPCAYDAPETLLSFPHRGRPGMKAGPRELVVSPLPWIVVYKVRDDVVHVVRILHGAQRWP